MVGQLQLNLYRLVFVWCNQGVVNVKSFEHLLKKRLQDNDIQSGIEQFRTAMTQLCTEHINSIHLIVNS